ncbi:MAG: phenylalanine--tRNA ligase subunit alpha [Chloroflexia bacterium]|nr:phenylalanine--tRNA ligase subunit alpha [Chloroflexia bacterium]
MSLPEQILAIQNGALDHLSTVDTTQELEDWRVQYLSRKGELAAAISRLADLTPEERRSAGQAANHAKAALHDALSAKSADLKAVAQRDSALDVTLPGIAPVVGGLHLTRQTLYEITRIFMGMGFKVFETNEVESDEYNFGLLNLPPDHPARDMWDTMYVSDDVVLRTHTSPGQIRAMRHFNPEPLRVILPGKCHRYEAVDASHESMFYQVEGLAVGEGITLASLKGVFEAFTQQMFGADRRVRFRGSYFPFTEPSVEIDITCNCLGAGCAVCKGTGWLEVSGGGMVHPTVLRNGGYDPDIVSGFAFGMGVERNAMLRHGIDDIRHVYANDLRFLKQFT